MLNRRTFTCSILKSFAIAILRWPKRDFAQQSKAHRLQLAEEPPVEIPADFVGLG
jgi:hypothetical protein